MGPLLFFLALAVAAGTVHRLNVPGAAGVPTWFSTLTFFNVAPNAVQVSLSGVIGTPFPSKPGPPRLVPGGVANETTQALNNIVGALEFVCANVTSNAAACDIDWRLQLTKCSVFLALLAPQEEALFNNAWVSFFAGVAPPARMAFLNAVLVVSAKVEIQCDAFFSTQ